MQKETEAPCWSCSFNKRSSDVPVHLHLLYNVNDDSTRKRRRIRSRGLSQSHGALFEDLQWSDTRCTMRLNHRDHTPLNHIAAATASEEYQWKWLLPWALTGIWLLAFTTLNYTDTGNSNDKAQKIPSFYVSTHSHKPSSSPPPPPLGAMQHSGWTQKSWRLQLGCQLLYTPCIGLNSTWFREHAGRQVCI